VYVGNRRTLVHVPTVDDRTERGLSYLQHLLPFAPAFVMLLVLLARRFTRKAPNPQSERDPSPGAAPDHINSAKNA
jgi:hypothetical protein